MSTPEPVVVEAFRLMEDSEEKQAQANAAAQLQLKALKAAKKAKGR